MLETGKAYLLTPEEADKVTKLVVLPDRKINPAYIGKDVQVILREIGIELGEQYRLAIFEAHRDHPLVWLEQMMPVMPIVRVKDVWEGIEFAVKVEQGNRHTALMHSNHTRIHDRLCARGADHHFREERSCVCGYRAGR